MSKQILMGQKAVKLLVWIYPTSGLIEHLCPFWPNLHAWIDRPGLLANLTKHKRGWYFEIEKQTTWWKDFDGQF